jgi:hypothetical protein
MPVRCNGEKRLPNFNGKFGRQKRSGVRNFKNFYPWIEVFKIIWRICPWIEVLSMNKASILFYYYYRRNVNKAI